MSLVVKHLLHAWHLEAQITGHLDMTIKTKVQFPAVDHKYLRKYSSYYMMSSQSSHCDDCILCMLITVTRQAPMSLGAAILFDLKANPDQN